LILRNPQRLKIKLIRHDEAYVSAFTFNGGLYFVEHNEKLSSDDVAKIFSCVFGALFKMNALLDENEELEK
jgi:hypothetical protein